MGEWGNELHSAFAHLARSQGGSRVGVVTTRVCIILARGFDICRGWCYNCAVFLHCSTERNTRAMKGGGGAAETDQDRRLD